MNYSTDIPYHDRASKATYVAGRYRDLLGVQVLDVGGDAGHLRSHVEQLGGQYTAIGFGPGVDREYDLEHLPYPFADKSFDTVLCLDVLEHLEQAHGALDELCRIARHSVVICLPNPWATFWSLLRVGDYRLGQATKFYGLPVHRPADRHRWFYGLHEARAFLEVGAQNNGFQVTQIEEESKGRFWLSGWRGWLQRLLFRRLFRADIDQLGLVDGPLWCVLQRQDES